MESPLVSVIIPAYNVEKYIGKLIEDLQSQTFKNWEAIIIDDCSTDRTTEIVRRYAKEDHRITLQCRPTNSGGAFIPRLEAAETSTTEFLVAIDADDRINETYLEALYAKAKASDADIVFPMNYTEREVSNDPLFDSTLINADTVSKGKQLVKYTQYDWKFGANGALYRKQLYLTTLKEAPKTESTHKIGKLSRPLTNNPFFDEIVTRILLIKSNRVTFATEAKYFYQHNEQSVVTRSLFLKLDTNTVRQLLVKEYFNEDSEEYALLQKETFFFMIDLMKKKCDRQARALLKKTYERGQWKAAKPYVSTKYYLLLSSGFRPAQILLRILGLLTKVTV